MAPPYLLLVLLLLPLLTVVPSMRAASPTSPPVSLPGCRNKCGNLTVPYPFGFEPNCFRKDFGLVCNESHNLPQPQLSISGYNYEITDISPRGELHISVTAKRACYNSSGGYISGTSASTYIALSTSPYLLSVSNSFFSVGCPNQGYFVDAEGYYVSGCVSACQPPQYLGSTNGSCTGVGCCQTSIPNGLRFYEPYLQNFASSRPGIDPIIFTNPTNCSYVFLADSNWFQFDNSYLTRTNDFKVQVRIDWAVRNVGNCSYARRNMTDYACRSANHDCYNSDNGAGYLCNCSRGYQGNPYITGGCQDVNECEYLEASRCIGICINTVGSFTCGCPLGMTGDGRKDGSGCKKSKAYQLGFALGIIIWLGFGIAVIILLLYFAIVKRIKLSEKRKQEKLKQKFFVQNRGLLLQQLIASHEDATQNMRILRLHELEKATNRFDNALIIGRGGHGEVYKGILSDQRVVAIKRSKIVDPAEIDQFINEVVILSQVNHRNIVKLYGCCLETEVPLLAYEFISNGTLFNHLHLEEHCSLTWKHRLRIALEAAGAISYLHSSASISVFHRDIKSSNILLDDYFTAKVSDFGASRSVQIDQTGVTTAIQGTHGYLDPEYYCTGRLTQKSDVYSFGVILAELLTREKPLFSSRKFEGGSLIAYFSSAMKENRLFEILDPQVVNEGHIIELEAVAKIAQMCLRMKGEERPTMKEVEVRLEVLWRSNQQLEHPWTSQSLEERQLMLPDYIAGIDTTLQRRFEQDLQSSSKFLSVNDPFSI